MTYATTTNRITTTGYAYDANGNLTSDGTHSYTWDADGHLASLDGTSNTETYDAQGRRVEQLKSGVYTEILYAPSGAKLALMNGQAVTKMFVPLPGGATGVYAGTSLSYYRHPDWLGSSRVATTTARAVYYDGEYSPYGESYNETGTTDRNFTGQNQDLPNASDLYNFPNREHNVTQGRWISPDPAGMGAADPSLPQNWNRYAYVPGNPTNQTDPTGLDGVCGVGGTWMGEGCYSLGIGVFASNVPMPGAYNPYNLGPTGQQPNPGVMGNDSPLTSEYNQYAGLMDAIFVSEPAEAILLDALKKPACAALFNSGPANSNGVSGSDIAQYLLSTVDYQFGQTPGAYAVTSVQTTELVIYIQTTINSKPGFYNSVVPGETANTLIHELLHAGSALLPGFVSPQWSNQDDSRADQRGNQNLIVQTCGVGSPAP